MIKNLVNCEAVDNYLEAALARESLVSQVSLHLVRDGKTYGSYSQAPTTTGLRIMRIYPCQQHLQLVTVNIFVMNSC